MARPRSGFHGEADFDGHLPVIHLSLVDIAARFDHLEPAQVLDSLVRALNGPANSVLDGGGGGAGKFDEFIDVVFHILFFGLVRHHRDGSAAAQGFGIGASFVGFVHDALNLGGIRSGGLRMQLHRQEVAALFNSNSAQQKQDDQNGQHHTQSAGRTIAPIPAMWPGRERADQQQNEQNH